MQIFKFLPESEDDQSSWEDEDDDSEYLRFLMQNNW